MDKEEKLRSEIEEKYKWDLTTIYKNEKKWYEEYDMMDKEVENIIKYKDTFYRQPKIYLSF